MRQGDTIGGYTLIQRLGSGGFGAVWLAEKRSHFVTKRVAVKLPHEDQVDFDAIRKEATLWEQASGHPNVLPIIDADIYDGQVLIVSEYAEGGSLADQLKEVGTTSVKDAVELTIGILNGLEFLHGRGIIHRDIKPANILLQGKTPRLADFGISRAMQTTAVSSTIIGTDAYMAPEAFDGKRSIQTDIWSVGVVLYQLLKGSLPFPQEHPSERMFAVLTKDFAPLDADVPPVLRQIVEKALNKLPENRYRTTSEMRDDLQRTLVGIAHPTLTRTEVLHIRSSEPSPALQEPREVETVVRPAASSVGDPNETSRSVVTLADSLGAEFEVLGKPLPTSESRWKRHPLMVITLGCALLVVGVAVIIGIASRKAPRKNFYDYPSLTRFSDNTANKVGYKDSNVNGGTVVPARFDDGGSFSEGYAAVKVNGKWGYIDSKGTQIIAPQYKYASPFSEGVAAVAIEEDAPAQSMNSNSGSKRLRYGSIDTAGKTVVPFIYDNLSFFRAGLAAATLNDNCGYIDHAGKQVIAFRYATCDMFDDTNSVADVAVKTPGDAYNMKYALIDKSGHELTIFKYDSISNIWSEGLTDYKMGEKWGVINNTGTEVTPAVYDGPVTFSSGLAKVKQNGREFYINTKGAEATPPPGRTY